MRSIKLPLVLFIVALISQTIAADVTVYYRPTPFPTRDENGFYKGHANHHILDGWITNVYYGQQFQKDDRYQIGGWGDNYRTYIQFDLEGLPQNVKSAALWLYAYPRGDNSKLVNFDMWRNLSPWSTPQTTTTSWSTTMMWNNQPPVALVSGVGVSSLPVNIYWSINITALYNNWRSGIYPNYGLTFMSWTQNNNFDVWRSSRHTDINQRPLLSLTFNQPAGTPNFKLPLPGGASWLLTNEVGGFESQGADPHPDTSHQGKNYFALDFSPTNIRDGGGAFSGPIPVLASASGTITDIGSTLSTGYYVTIDHGSGYITRSIHFKDPPTRKNGTNLRTGDKVNQGDQIGIMGNEGTSFGAHLHINFWYGAPMNGDSAIPTLQTLTLEGLLLKSYQTESEVNSNGIPIRRIRYYRSTNTQTGK